MTFDPTGTQPGLNPAVTEEQKLIAMRCRVERCTSTQVTEIAPPSNLENAGAPHNRVYRCVKCGHSWAASVGGYVSL